VGQFGSLEEFYYDQIQALMTINFSSPVFFNTILAPFLKTQDPQ
jgi:hypothetical protein